MSAITAAIPEKGREDEISSHWLDIVAWSSWSARQSVTLEVAGSSPVVTAIATIGVVKVWLPFR